MAASHPKGAAMLALLAISTTGFAQETGGAVGDPATVKAVIDYSETGSGEADRFFELLDANTGKVIALELDIIPRQEEGSPGYSLSEDAEGESVEDVVCGSGSVGIIDNFSSVYRLTFQHPDHFHAPAEIVIGDRARYPFQSIRCGAESVGENAFTQLHVAGHFVVATAEIPTAVTYTLYPYDQR